MRIGEIAELTGLNISNIRFYEKKGLMEPAREAENKYREYTEADLQRLKEIMLYRKMNLSIEQIAQIFDGNISVEKAVKQQLVRLEEEKEKLEGSIALCQKILESKGAEKLHTDYFLNYIKEEEEKGIKFAQLDEWLDGVVEFVNLSFFRGYPFVSSFLYNKTLLRLLSGFLIICIFLLPALVLWDSYKDHGEFKIGAIIFCVIWLGNVLIFLVKYHHQNR